MRAGFKSSTVTSFKRRKVVTTNTIGVWALLMVEESGCKKRCIALTLSLKK